MKHIKDSWIRNSIHALAINIIEPGGCKKHRKERVNTINYNRIPGGRTSRANKRGYK